MAEELVFAARNSSRAGFNFTAHMRSLCIDIARRLPQMSHICMDRVALAFCQTRKRVSHGLYAALTPMRFECGSVYAMRQAQRYRCQRLFDETGKEYLYILSFYLPRFLQISCREKLVTVFHELWHISPAFDGDIRRHEGRCYVHSHSQRQYDAKMQQLVHQWLSLSPPEYLYGFLQFNFRQLERRYGNIYGTRIPQPKLIPVDALDALTDDR